MEQLDGQTTIDHLLAPAQPAAPQPVQADPGQAAAPVAQGQEPPVQTPAPDPAQPAPPAATPDVRSPQTVPLPELLEQRHARQLAERENQLLRQQLQQFYEAQQRANQPQPQPIDPVSQPEAAYAALQQELARRDQMMEQMALHQRANTSEMIARSQHGDQIVDQAIDSAVKSGLNQHFMRQPDPYKALITWHKSQQIAQEIGNDPNAYRARIEAEVRAKILAEMKAGTPPPRNLPPSLASATKANSAPEIVQEASDFFKGMMNRKG